jgi:hypothetical protein
VERSLNNKLSITISVSQSPEPLNLLQFQMINKDLSLFTPWRHVGGRGLAEFILYLGTRLWWVFNISSGRFATG